jgi:hypothetical protein
MSTRMDVHVHAAACCGIDSMPPHGAELAGDSVAFTELLWCRFTEPVVGQLTSCCSTVRPLDSEQTDEVTK